MMMMMMMMMICTIDKRTHMSSVAMIFILQNYVQENERGWVFCISQEFYSSSKIFAGSLKCSAW
jgi:hypothetical protein